PSPTNFHYLRQNLALLPSAEAFAYGLSDRAESIKLYVGREQTMQSSVIASDQTTGEYEPAELRRASDEFDRLGFGPGLPGPSILKLDTEGCELPILRDLGPRLGAVDLLYVEYHSED